MKGTELNTQMAIRLAEQGASNCQYLWMKIF
jgi:hypothetical protein